MKHSGRFVAFIVVCFLSFFWDSQSDATPMVRRLPSRDQVLVAGDAGVGAYAGTAVSTLQASLDLTEGRLQLSTLGRVRLWLEESDDRQTLRTRDWDEASDYVHILRLLRYQRGDGGLRVDVAVSEHADATVGNGTILRHYSNVVDPDHLHTGAQVQFSSDHVDVVVLVDNLIGPKVFGGRVGVRPWKNLSQLLFGATTIVDPRAPVRILTDASGQRQIDEAFNLLSEARLFAMSGVDVSYRIGSDESASWLKPYLDVNTSYYGMGLHGGVAMQLYLEKAALRLFGQVEYRLSSPGYSASYFGTFYDLERYQASMTNGRDTKLAALVSPIAAQQNGHHGVLLEAGAQWAEKLELMFGYEHRPGVDAHQLTSMLKVMPISSLDFAAVVVARGLGAVNTSRGIAVMAEARYQVTRYLYAIGQFSRQWALDATTRYFLPINTFNLGIGGSWSDG